MMDFTTDNIKNIFEKIKKITDKDDYIDELVNSVLYILINNRKDKEEINEDRVNEFKEDLKQIIYDIYHDYIERTESKNNICGDIEYIGNGYFSIAIRVGDNVLKTGKVDYDIDKLPGKKIDSKDLVPIYYRKSIDIGGEKFLSVEISPLVQTNNISREDLYNAYSSVRSLGFIWNDPKEENLGRIINVSGCKVGGKSYFPKYQYNKGDIVLIDVYDITYVGPETSDMILDEISMMSYNTNVYKFETRYMEEKKKTGKKL